ncbi:hypothetical protein [Microcella humidisoli]|uniref:Uncharacterized protein n=1 Tax=Microcella humidisoli TaxID=2963406 RepID=A0ABY5FUM8_9MICO|nr:hypothetical protein [Microcella humidisoli]UTT61988.1 hypothetical protein NNL39_09950 [Microcella humidisoli]
MSNPTDPPLSRRAARQAELSAQDAPPEGFAQPVTRRVRGGTPVSVPSSAPSDVAYRTQVRPRVPHYDAAPPTHTVITPGDHGTAESPAPSSEHGAPLAPPVAPPVAPPPAQQVRRRDFRPPTEQPFAPPTAEFDTSLEYHTQLTPRPEQPAVPAPAPAPHVIAPMPQGGDLAPSAEAQGIAASPSAFEQTLSRRELRALREPVAEAPTPLVAPPAPAAAPSAAPVAEPAPAPPAALSAEPAPAPAPAAVVAEPVPLAPQFVAPPPVPLAEPAPEPYPSAGSAPTGSHWSVGIHDDDDPFENTFSREVGSTASLTNTNALVLPEMPSVSIAGPVAGTGEIIITGMIDLPRVVSSTGAVPQVHESPDVDDLLEPGEFEVAHPDSAPVSALRAVSSHTGAAPIMATGKGPASNTVTTVLVASTVVMAVVAIGLFVLAAVNGLF